MNSSVLLCNRFYRLFFPPISFLSSIFFHSAHSLPTFMSHHLIPYIKYPSHLPSEQISSCLLVSHQRKTKSTQWQWFQSVSPSAPVTWAYAGNSLSGECILNGVGTNPTKEFANCCSFCDCGKYFTVALHKLLCHCNCLCSFVGVCRVCDFLHVTIILSCLCFVTINISV